MKNSFLLLAFVLLASSLFAQKNPAKIEKKDAMAAPVVLKTAVDSANYAYGLVLSANLKRQLGNDFNQDIFMAALNAGLQGQPALCSNDDAGMIVNNYNKTVQARDIEKNRQEGIHYLEQNKKRKEVTTTASGLQYEVLQRGAGTVSPKATDKVEVNYHGTLIDGTVFDSSVERKKSISFPLNGVIKGWTEGVQLMHEGDKFKFFIPANLAYGDQPPPRSKIKAGSTLIFEVELIKIEAPAPAPTGINPGN